MNDTRSPFWPCMCVTASGRPRLHGPSMARCISCRMPRPYYHNQTLNVQWKGRSNGEDQDRPADPKISFA